MTRDDILRMAIDAGAEEYGPLTRNWTFKQHHLERFAALVAAAEREKLKSNQPEGDKDEEKKNEKY